MGRGQARLLCPEYDTAPRTLDGLPTESSTFFHEILCFPDGSDGKESACNVGDLGLIPGLGRSPGGGLGNPLQNSCLENPTDRRAWRATVHEDAESDTTERLSTAQPYLREE